jgi:hypothetical protein
LVTSFGCLKDNIIINDSSAREGETVKKIIRNTLIVFAMLAPMASFAQSILPDPNLGISDKPITVILANFVKWLLGIFGFIAIIAFIISGIQYLVSAGDEDMQQRAKKNFQYSIIGVVVGLSGLIIITAVQTLLMAQTSQF